MGAGICLLKYLISSSSDCVDCASVSCHQDEVKRKPVIITIFVVLVAVIFWPWLGDPFGYVHWRDRFRTSIPVAVVLGEPCTSRRDGIIHYDHSPNCVRFDPPREYDGIWLYEFEGSTFLEHAKVVPKKRPPWHSAPWLDYDPVKIDPKPEYNRDDSGQGCFPIHAFAIRFIGRRDPNGGGHLGSWNSNIIVDRVLSAKPLGPLDCRTYNADG